MIFQLHIISWEILRCVLLYNCQCRYSYVTKNALINLEKNTFCLFNKSKAKVTKFKIEVSSNQEQVLLFTMQAMKNKENNQKIIVIFKSHSSKLLFPIKQKCMKILHSELFMQNHENNFGWLRCRLKTRKQLTSFISDLIHQDIFIFYFLQSLAFKITAIEINPQ
jgi:hypothetical protein